MGFCGLWMSAYEQEHGIGGSIHTSTVSTPSGGGVGRKGVGSRGVGIRVHIILH